MLGPPASLRLSPSPSLSSLDSSSSSPSAKYQIPTDVESYYSEDGTSDQDPTDPTQQSPEEIQRLKELVIKLQKQIDLIQMHVEKNSTRPSQPHVSMHGPSTSQYPWQMSPPPPSQQPPLAPYHYPNMYGPPLQQPPPPYHYPYTYEPPSQQPALSPYHYPYTYEPRLQQPTPPYHYPNTFGLPLQQPTPPHHYPNRLPLQQPTPPHHYPNTYDPLLQQPTPPYHYPNTFRPPLQQPTPPYHHPNTFGPLLQQPTPPHHYPNTYGPQPQQPMPPRPKVSDNAKDPSPKRGHTAQEVQDHPKLQNTKKVSNLSEMMWARLEQFSTMNKFKRLVLLFIGWYMSVNDAGFKALISDMDTSSRGMINEDELRVGLHKLDDQIPDSHVHVLMIVGDLDKDGYLNYLEIVGLFAKLRLIGNDDKYLRIAFELFDENQTKYIEIDDLRHCLADVVHENTEEVVEAIMEEVDIDKDGKISYDEFVAMMMSDIKWRKSSRK
ncbi:hypothetical protein F8388_010934 [Cannabis sativa]|uniref:EF-hand domain-containing protein n=2 Tax=Cannabis sativa TaxID=3483 RepID=A0A7J6EE91_CANSA|nr:hypothetical protein F8388_010934 [Cannabis sativa]KAF4396150.1 hypothetical protein G4B88_020787 [Cannabis sativa]